MQRALAYLARRPDPLTSLVLTVPVFLTYHLGIVWIDRRNGVDLFTSLTLELLDYSLWGYLGATLTYAAGLVGAGALLRERGTARPATLLPVVVESACWALLMLGLLGWALEGMVSWTPNATPLGPVDKVVMAAGAGFHEEAVFRVALFSGGAFALERAGRIRRAHAFAIAAIASSLAFSAMHHVGAAGDPFGWHAFAFRTLAGLFLSLLYGLRGFAVAVYTHAAYDAMVFFVVD
ncbi:MAG: CPBP family glutamic-type intramembrane protease [Proteobacteria bacterium]|nr:CPBP family glutamic-type intramembrane protease [Pseudomonadota bacterium]